MDSSFDARQAQLNRDIAALAIRRLSFGTAITGAVSLMLVLIASSRIGEAQYTVWMAALAVVFVARVASFLSIKRAFDHEGLTRFVQRKLTVSGWLFAISDGLIWASASWVVFALLNVGLYGVMSLTLVAVAAFGLIYMFQPAAAMAAMALAGAPLLVFPFADTGSEGFYMAALIGVLIGAICLGVYELRRHIFDYLYKNREYEQMVKAHKLAEQKEKEANFIFNQQWQNTPLAAIEWNRAFRITRWNPSAEAVFGYSEQEVIGKSLELLFADNEFAKMKQTWQNIWRNKKGRRSVSVCRNKLGEAVYCEWHDSVLTKDNVAFGITSFVEDVSSQVASRKIIKRQADFDTLTGLPNRRMLMSKLDAAIKRCKKTREFSALIFLDLDHFKDINDTEGHDVGDVVLVEFAKKLRLIVRQDDAVARFGGDEFVVLLNDLGTSYKRAAANAQLVADKLLVAGEDLCKVADVNYSLDVSGGITLFNGSKSEGGELLKTADLAMYQVKKNGRKGICFYDESLSLEAEYRVHVQRSLREGFQKNEFELYNQPIVDVRNNATYYESLLRWRPGNERVIPTCEFIDILAGSPMILTAGYWVLESVCANINILRKQGLWGDDSAFFVNVSPRQLEDKGFSTQLKKILATNDIESRWIVIEITEESLIDRHNDVIKQLDELVEFGIRVALDDFGTGYSSLALLRDLPIQFLKLDKEFVRNLECDQSSKLIVEAVVSLCEAMSLKVIAEGVETEQQSLILRALGLDFIQGYHYHKPMPMDELCVYLRGECSNNNIYPFSKQLA